MLIVCLPHQSQRQSALFFFSSRRRQTRCYRDWSSDVCSSDLAADRQRGAHEAIVGRALFLELPLDPSPRLFQRAAVERFVQITRHSIELFLAVVLVGL